MDSIQEEVINVVQKIRGVTLAWSLS